MFSSVTGGSTNTATCISHFGVDISSKAIRFYVLYKLHYFYGLFRSLDSADHEYRIVICFLKNT